MQEEKKNKFLKVAFIILGVLALIAILSDVLESQLNDAVAGILMIPLLPGFVVYILVTGDIHGWQPGPIGQAGRIFVTTLGSWIFWTPLAYWIYRKRKKK